MSGGGSVVSYDIVNTLVELNNEVTVLVPDVEWNEEKFVPPLNPKINVVRVETPYRSNLKVAARRCKNNLEKNGLIIGNEKKIDFIFTIFHPFHLVPNAAVSCAMQMKIPVIVKIDDAIYEKSSGIKSIQRRIEKMYSTKTLQNASCILVSNESIKKIIHDYYKIDEEKISIVPNGIDTSLFKKNKKKELIVIFSGAMYYHRGLDILLKSAPKVVAKIPNVKFLLLGDGPEIEKLKDVTRENRISKNVEFKGWIERNEIPNYLADGTIGIGPLRSTTVTKNALPIKVLEYMASSLPIIAAEETLPNDVLRNDFNGYFIKDVDELTEKIIFLLQNEEIREKFGNNSKELVAKFDWKTVGKMILNEYNKIKN